MWIRLKNISIFAYHGAYEHERELGQRFSLDVEIEANLADALREDTLDRTIDYAELLQGVIEFSERERFTLLETWAERLASRVREHYPTVNECIVRIRKPGAAFDPALEVVEVEYRSSGE